MNFRLTPSSFAPAYTYWNIALAAPGHRSGTFARLLIKVI
jgi:hypothetical protein